MIIAQYLALSHKFVCLVFRSRSREPIFYSSTSLLNEVCITWFCVTLIIAICSIHYFYWFKVYLLCDGMWCFKILPARFFFFFPFPVSFSKICYNDWADSAFKFYRKYQLYVRCFSFSCKSYILFRLYKKNCRLLLLRRTQHW